MTAPRRLTHTDGEAENRSGTFSCSLPPVTFLPHQWRLSDKGEHVKWFMNIFTIRSPREAGTH